MFDTDEYRTKLLYPSKPFNPSVKNRPTAAEARAYADAKEKYDSVDKPAYEAEIAAYRADEARLLQKFWDDAAKELGYTNNPKRAKLEQKAWETGHSSGLSEVYIYLSDLVELIE